MSTEAAVAAQPPATDRDALAHLLRTGSGVEVLPNEQRWSSGVKCNTCRKNTTWFNGRCVNPRCETNWIAVPRDLADRLAARPAPDTLADRVQALRSQHRPDGGVGGPGAMCVACTPDFGTVDEEPVAYPCAVSRTLDALLAGRSDASPEGGEQRG